VDNCSAAKTALIGNKCYSAFSTKANWYAAKDNCEALGLTLASIENQAENDILHSTAEPMGISTCGGHVWTGLRSSLTADGPTEGTWSWIVDPEPQIPIVPGTNFENWYHSQQDGGGSAPICGGVYPWKSSSEWFDHSCSMMVCYICMDHQETSSIPSLYPSSDPSSLPIAQPSVKPSGAPSDNPSNQPSNNPTIEEAPKFEWYIDLINNATMSGESALLIDFNISNRVFDIDVFQTDCVTTVTGALKETEIVMGLGDGFKKVAVSVEIDQAEIEGNNVWTSSANGGEIDFCIVMKLFLNETRDDLIQFMETQFKITVDKTTHFTIAEVATDRISARRGGVENIDYEVDIDAYQCEDDGKRKIPTPMTQGDIMQVCVKVDESTKSIFEVDQIYSFDITQGAGGTPVKVLYNDGNSMQYPTLTDVQKIDLPNNIIKVKFQLLGNFFLVQDDPDSLKVTGKVKLALANTRRHLQDSAGAAISVSRKLHEENSEFVLDIDLAGGSTSSAWESNGNALSFAILTGGVYNIW